MPKEKKESETKKTKKTQKAQFLKKSLLDSKDIKQVTQNIFNNLRTNIDSIKKMDLKNSSFIYDNYPYEHIHYSIIKLGLKISKNRYESDSEVYLEFLQTIRDIVLETDDCDKKIFTRYIEQKLEVLRKILSEFVRLDETMMSLFDYFYKILKIINLEANFEIAKIWFADKIDEFIERRLQTAEKMLVDHGRKIIKNNDNILVISISDVITKTIITCFKNDIKFNVYLVLDDTEETKNSAIFLQNLGIKVICTNTGNLSFFMNKIHKVFAGGYCMYSNGYLTSRSGTAIAAIFAKKFRKPFYVFIRTFQFSHKIQIDALMINESYYAGENENVVFLEKDLIPDRLISLIVTEIGLMPPTTVPVILREFNFDFEKIVF